MTNLIEKLKNRFKDIILDSHANYGDQTVVVSKEHLKALVRFVKTDPEFDMNLLIDITAVDYLPLLSDVPFDSACGERSRTTQGRDDKRFEAVYHFYSINFQHRLRIKVRLTEESPEVDTLTDLWPIADWLEREVWDMFGIRFKGHPNLKRLLMYEEFVGHPLRKDYAYNKRQPLIGPKN